MPHIAVCISAFRDNADCYFSAQERPSFHNRLYRYLAVLIDIHTTYWLDENLYKWHKNCINVYRLTVKDIERNIWSQISRHLINLYLYRAGIYQLYYINLSPLRLPNVLFKTTHQWSDKYAYDVDRNGSQLIRYWFLSHKWPAKALASLRMRAVSPVPSLFWT